MAERPALVLFARAPIPGRAKTRLIPALGPEAAAELYRRFLLDSLGVAAQQRAEVLVAVDEESGLEAVCALAQQACPRARCLLQRGPDLGARMRAAFDEAFREGHHPVVIMGTDAPTLPPSRLGEALERLGRTDVVLGPTLDGGYYLIGLATMVPAAFEDIPWGGPEVLVATLRRLKGVGASVSLLSPWWDVDVPQDLRWLRTHLLALELAGAAIPCPHTWRFLRQLRPEG